LREGLRVLAGNLLKVMFEIKNFKEKLNKIEIKQTGVIGTKISKIVEILINIRLLEPRKKIRPAST
jgi:hypothetical protein